ncbi:tetrapyrrole (Corrin/Porphyrin) methylases [Ceratobasidium sp. AG-Ba]|nr:tetrapyrrole (Corrin/Porphyrin) methylases [Ceratobasidium sp. AG-Ba]
MRVKLRSELLQAILQEVRGGHNVVALIFGHPGITASPAHRALAVARQEGYATKMLPGISVEACMFASLEIDPASHGCDTCEATELVVHRRHLNPTVHNIVLNIGNVGEREDRTWLPVLIDILEDTYGRDHRVLHYLGENLPPSSTAMVAYSLDELRVDTLSHWIRPTSALYIPPRHSPEAADSPSAVPDIALRYLSSFVELQDTVGGSRPITITNYGDYLQEAQDRLSHHVIPETYKSLRASSAMKKFMIDLSLDPNLKERYNSGTEARQAMLNGVVGLTDRERFALRMGQAGPIAAIMLRTSDLEPTEEELERIGGEYGGDYPHPIIAT